jgi:hypothetical protein
VGSKMFTQIEADPESPQGDVGMKLLLVNPVALAGARDYSLESASCFSAFPIVLTTSDWNSFCSSFF